MRTGGKGRWGRAERLDGAHAGGGDEVRTASYDIGYGFSPPSSMTMHEEGLMAADGAGR